MGLTHSYEQTYKTEYKQVLNELRNAGVIKLGYTSYIGLNKFKPYIPQVILLLALKHNDTDYADYIIKSKMFHNMVIPPIQEYLLILSDTGIINNTTEKWMYANIQFDDTVIYNITGVNEMILGSVDTEYFEYNLLNHIQDYLK